MNQHRCPYGMKPLLDSITQNGKPLDRSFYTIDFKRKIFTTKESDLSIFFPAEDGWMFKTGSYCTFDTRDCCTFDTGSYCTFDTWDGCIFDTGNDCIFLLLECGFIKCGKRSDIYKRYIGSWPTRFNIDLKPDISTLILEDGTQMEFKSIKDAILNNKHKDQYVRIICKQILEGKIDLWN